MNTEIINRFINKKIESKVPKPKTLGDFINGYDEIIKHYQKPSNHRPEFKNKIIQICEYKKSTMIKLYQNKKFLALTANEIYKMMMFKEKFKNSSGSNV